MASYPLTDYDAPVGKVTPWYKTRCFRSLIFITLLVIVILVGVHELKKSSGGDEGGKIWETEIRLPTTLTPEVYEVTLQTNLATFAFNGSSIIHFSVAQKTDLIILHSLDLNILSLSVTDENQKKVDVNDYFLYEPHQFLVVQLASPLALNAYYTLSIHFKGVISEGLAGYYRSSYVTASGVTRWLASTQFESTDARRAFPCWDEPSFKANFSIVMIHDPTFEARSNMPALSSVYDNQRGAQVTTFETSVKMSTYLVAFLVSDFKSLESNTTSQYGSTKVGVFARSDIINSSGQIALNAAVQQISFYEDFYSLAYPLPKQDLIAVPDFSFGAMENWGLITFRETALMWDPNTGSAANKQRVVVVVAHELAHQWFGNIVTMAWWDGLWLNEGFAAYMEYVGTDHSYPEWRMWSQFLVDTQSFALALDASANSHPVLQEVNDPNQINELFDSISYDKGASLIRMMANFLGDETFMDGLTLYLTTHAYGNTETVDLWNTMTEAAQQNGITLNISEIMDTWTLQMGYPVLMVQELGNEIRVTQKRFLDDPNAPANASEGYAWHVPVSFHFQNRAGELQWLKPNMTFLSIPYNAETDGYYKLNTNQTNFYRVDYSDQNWNRLQLALMKDDPNLSESDRGGLLEDVFSLANANYFDVSRALNMSLFLTTEPADSYAIWATALSKLNTIDYLLRAQNGYEAWLTYLQSILQQAVDTIGWDNTGSHTTQLARSLLIGAGTRYNVSTARSQAVDLFQQFKQNPSNNPIFPDLRTAVYDTGVAELGLDAWEFMYNQYAQELDSTEKRKCLLALAAASDPNLLQKTLEYSINTAFIKSQDTISVIVRVAQNNAGQELAWDFVQANWEYIYSNFGESSSFSSLISGVLSNFQTQEKYNEITTFFANKDLGTAARTYLQALESIQVNIDWIAHNYESTLNWLTTFKPTLEHLIATKHLSSNRTPYSR